MSAKAKEHPLWIVWWKMRSRCDYPSQPDYDNYGARGIDYDRKWLNFRVFLADMEAGWQPGLTLERIDNNGNYCKENCKWATRKENNRNKRNTKLTAEKAETIRKLLQEGRRPISLANEFGVSPQLICDIRAGRAWND